VASKSDRYLIIRRLYLSNLPRLFNYLPLSPIKNLTHFEVGERRDYLIKPS
jgi:hypothetical protein